MSSADTLPDYKWGQKVVPPTPAKVAAENQEVANELNDTFLELDNEQRTTALRQWASGQPCGITDKAAYQYLGRHRWHLDGDTLVDNYQVDDLVVRGKYIGTEQLRNLHRQIALASAELQFIQVSADKSDANVQQRQAALEEHLMGLLAQQEVAKKQLLQRKEEWPEVMHDVLPEALPTAEHQASTTTAAATAPPHRTQHQQHAALGSAAVGVLCGLGIRRYLGRLIQRRGNPVQSVLGIVSVVALSAVVLLGPGALKRPEQLQRVPEFQKGYANLLVADAEDSPKQ